MPYIAFAKQVKFLYSLMSACHSLRSHSLLKKVLKKLGNPYQIYINTYKTHTMTSCHGGTGQPLEKDPNPQEQDIDTPNDYQHEGLTHSLITEALNLDKSWEEIKDLLCLKLCSLDIHTSVSCFMGIQLKDKASLAAYIHRFKREAKRCNFTNNASTIQIFIKGLKNTHTLVTWVYEKGPQMLADAISKVEKLQAVQQLTTTLLPSSTVNVM